MNIGFKNTRKQVLFQKYPQTSFSFPQEGTPNKDFTQFQIKFDPLNLSDL